MRGKDLYEKISDIDNEIIAENLCVRKARKPVYIKFLAAAACFTIIISAVFLLQRDNEKIDPDLPLLTLDTEFSGSMGFEGYMAWNISDLTNSNPWNEDMNLTRLPVIENKLTYGQMMQVVDPDFDLMESLLKQTAQNLGMEIENLTITSDAPDEEKKQAIADKFAAVGEEVPEEYFNVKNLFIEDEKYKVEVDTAYTVLVNFKSPVKLPDEYNFTHYAAYDDTYAVAEYLRDEYSDFIGMDNPATDISGGDFNIYAQQSYHISFYQESDDIVQNILNYHFNTVNFYCDDNGTLFLARKYYTDLSGIAGEYPVIDTKEALRLLKNGHYITTVPQKFESTDYVRKVELVYRTDTMQKLYIPYYRFYVELPDMKCDNGLNTYGAYYVPAIESHYIENMPVWDGEFN